MTWKRSRRHSTGSAAPTPARSERRPPVRRGGGASAHYRGPDRRLGTRLVLQDSATQIDDTENGNPGGDNAACHGSVQRVAPRPRFRSPTPSRRTPVDGILLATALTLLCWLVVSFLLQSVGWSAPAASTIGATEVSLAGVAAAIAAICRHVTGRLAAGQLAAGAALLAASTLLGLLPPPGTAVMPAALADWTMPRAALTAVAGALLVQALVGPDVDSRSRPLRVLAMGFALSGVLIILLIGADFVVDLALAARFGATAALLPLPVWATVLAVGVRRMTRHPDRVTAVVTVLAALQLVAQVALSVDAAWSTHLRVWAPLLTVASWMLVIALLLDLLRAEAQQRRCELHLRLAQQQLGLVDRKRRDRERRHEVRNALLALEATTTALWRAELSPTEGDRDELGRLTIGLVAELRALLVTDNPDTSLGHLQSGSPAEPSPRNAPRQSPHPPAAHTASLGTNRFALTEVAHHEAAIARAQGLEVQVASAEDAIVRGNLGFTRQMVRNLLVNVARHTSGAHPPRATLLVHREGSRVVLRCIDDGPGIPVQLHDRVFAPDDRLDTEVAGEGLGPPIARRLAREQGGDLEVAATDDAGCFVLRLPADLEVASDSQMPNEVADLVEVGELDQRSSVRPSHRAASRRPLRGVEDEYEPVRGHNRDVDEDAQVEAALVIDVAR